MFEFDEPIAVL